jgi:hypothetical protein
MTHQDAAWKSVLRMKNATMPVTRPPKPAMMQVGREALRGRRGEGVDRGCVKGRGEDDIEEEREVNGLRRWASSVCLKTIKRWCTKHQQAQDTSLLRLSNVLATPGACFSSAHEWSLDEGSRTVGTFVDDSPKRGI